MVREKGWRDIRNAYCSTLLMSAIDVGGYLSRKLDTIAKREDGPAGASRPRDVIAAMLALPARKTETARAALTTRHGFLFSILGMAAGFGAAKVTMAAVGTALGAAFTAEGLVAGAAALGAGLCVAPLAAAAVGVGCSILLPMACVSAAYWPAMIARGWREAHPGKYAAAPKPAKPPPPSIMEHMENHLRTVSLSDSKERVDFFRSLRKRFPAEFNEAANLEAHDPVLRAPVRIKGPLKLRKPHEGGTL